MPVLRKRVTESKKKAEKNMRIYPRNILWKPSRSIHNAENILLRVRSTFAKQQHSCLVPLCFWCMKSFYFFRGFLSCISNKHDIRESSIPACIVGFAIKSKKKRNYDSLRCLGAWNFWFLLRPNKSNSIHTVEMIYELNIATIQYLAGKYFNWHWFLPKNNNNTKFCLFKTRNERLL